MALFSCCCCCKKCITEIPVVIPLSSSSMIPAFTKALKSKRIMLIRFEHVYPTSQEQLCVVVFLNTRLETNVSNALAEFQVDQYWRLVLLIVHCVPKKEDLPRESSKFKLMQLGQYKNLADVIDIAYYEDKGIYNCKTNKEALGKLRDRFQK